MTRFYLLTGMPPAMETLSQSWPWWLTGAAIAFTMMGLQYLGKTFGISSTLRTMCAVGGAGKRIAFFDIDWKGQSWNLAFAFGTVMGGLIAGKFMSTEQVVHISAATQQDLSSLGIPLDTEHLLPLELFSWQTLGTLKGFLFLVGGGFLVGFGARYAGGCTSGHAITGLSNLQLPSLIAVIGFFIGGLIMTHWLLPYVLP